MSIKYSVIKLLKHFHLIFPLSKYVQKSSLLIYFLCYQLKLELKHKHQLFGYTHWNKCFLNMKIELEIYK